MAGCLPAQPLSVHSLTVSEAQIVSHPSAFSCLRKKSKSKQKKGCCCCCYCCCCCCCRCCCCSIVVAVVVVVVVVLVVVVFPASKRHNEISTWHVFSNGSTCGHVGMGNSSAHLPLLSKNKKECSTTWQTKQKKEGS